MNSEKIEQAIAIKEKFDKAISINGLPAELEGNIKKTFLPYYEKLQEFKAKTETLIVTDVSQIELMAEARKIRLLVSREYRIAADKDRKAMKAGALIYEKAVQAAYNIIEADAEFIESHMERQEKFAEEQEKKRVAELKSIRDREVQDLNIVEYIPFGIDLGIMSEGDYGKLVTGANLQLKAKKDAEIKAEQDRLDTENAKKLHDQRKNQLIPFWNFLPIEKRGIDFSTLSLLEWNVMIASGESAKENYDKEQKKIKTENEKLRLENEKKDADAKAEREKAAAILKAEQEKSRIEREKLEAELKDKTEAENEQKEKARIELENQIKAQKKAEKAPDRTKLVQYANMIDGFIKLNIELKSDEAKKILADSKGLLQKVFNFIHEKSNLI